jgi:[ribosomal protein S5]-alanine N-acetyltransferase
MAVTRPISMDDAESLAALLTVNREFLTPWTPVRDDAYFTVDAQRKIIAHQLDAYARGTMIPLVIFDPAGEMAGRIDINGITRGAFQSASIGYWVSESQCGHGLASAAVADVVAIAFEGLGLHRLQAETLLHNVGSQRVLTRNGFRPFAVAPSYIQIAGQWQDHIMFCRFKSGAEDSQSPDNA